LIQETSEEKQFQ